jgi:hypothetical protein
MAGKKSTGRQIKSNEKREARRRRWLQIIIIGFSIILILSLILSLAAS